MTTILDKYLDGYTLVKAKGVWKGKSEDSLIIEIDFPTKTVIDCDIVHRIANLIREVNKQECVLVQRIECESSLI